MKKKKVTYKHLVGFTLKNRINKENATRTSSTKTVLPDHVLDNKKITCDVKVMLYKLSDHIPLSIDVYVKVNRYRSRDVKYINVVCFDKYKNNFISKITTIWKLKNNSNYKIRLKQREGNDG